MKKIYFLLLAFSFFTTTKAQIVDIPDANFKTKLLAANPSNVIAKNLQGQNFKIDANNDGEIQVSEALEVDYLGVGDSNISSMEGISSFSNIKHLSCYNNKLTSLDVKFLVNLKTLNCYGNQLTFIDVKSLVNFEILNCSGNKLTTLDFNNLPLNLKGLSCGGCQLTTLDVTSLVNLELLDCGSNQISLLDVQYLVNLKYLSCGGNKLSSLNVLPLVNLKGLECNFNQITSLDLSSLVNLESLGCQTNQLTSLDLIPLINLKTLSCGSNQLTSLNLSTLTSLKSLYCAKNQITLLDLGNLANLQTLECGGNQLTSLHLNNLKNLIELRCSENQITLFDLSNLTNLERLYCENNNFTSLFIKNTKIESNNFGFSGNVQYICANDKQLVAVQKYIDQYGYTNTHVNTYCTFTPGGEFYTIQGTVKFDSNNNGCDLLDTSYPNLKFAITNGVDKGNLITNLSGSYSIPVSAGTHTITPAFENPTYFKASPASLVITFPIQNSPFSQDFCVTANGVHPDLEVAILPINRARPGFEASYKIIYKNKGTNTQSGSVNLKFDDTVLDFVDSNLVIANQTVNNLSWNFLDLKPFETREIEVTLNVNSPMETPAVNYDDILSYTATIISTQTDETPTDNIFTFNQTVVNAFDPNDKTCLEGSTIPPSAVGKYVHYMIRFENKGTAEAQNVVVKDMIDTSKFDINSLVVTQGSHSFVTKISETNKVEFIFENINLPFDDANNDGYVAFKIKTKPSLVLGDSFSNTASIYFDYNFPIITNTATTSVLQNLGNQDFEFSTYFKVYPNPAKSVLNIDVKKQIELSSISIFNTLGQQILVIPNAQQTKQVDVSGLITGNYFIKVTSTKGSASGKFVKE